MVPFTFRYSDYLFSENITQITNYQGAWKLKGNKLRDRALEIVEVDGDRAVEIVEAGDDWAGRVPKAISGVEPQRRGPVSR